MSKFSPAAPRKHHKASFKVKNAFNILSAYFFIHSSGIKKIHWRREVRGDPYTIHSVIYDPVHRKTPAIFLYLLEAQTCLYDA